MEILKLLSTIDVPISAARIQGELNLPRSSTYHLLAEMVDAGFVAHLPEHKTYGLGLAAYSMASAYVTQQPLVRMATRDLEQCAALVGGIGAPVTYGWIGNFVSAGGACGGCYLLGH